MSNLDTDPHFSSEAQESFVEGCRVYLVEDQPNVSKAGAEGTYLGKFGNEAIVDWDTPSKTPRAFVAGVQFSALRNLYR